MHHRACRTVEREAPDAFFESVCMSVVLEPRARIAAAKGTADPGLCGPIFRFYRAAQLGLTA
jgi:hypothetical protein